MEKFIGKIYITKCSDSNKWYRERVGHIFLAEQGIHRGRGFLAYENGKEQGYVSSEDCIDISKPKTPELNKWMVNQEEYHKLTLFMDYIVKEQSVTLPASVDSLNNHRYAVIDEYLKINFEQVEKERRELEIYIEEIKSK